MMPWLSFLQRNLDRFCLTVFRSGCGVLCFVMTMGSAVAQDLYERVEHHYAENMECAFTMRVLAKGRWS